MSILLETTFGDIIIDLDVDGSPTLCKNILKLTKARYYTNTLIYNVVPGKYSQMGDPKGDGTGGCSIYGLIDSYQSSSADANSTNKSQHPVVVPDVTQSQRRFLQSQGRTLSSSELNQRGVVIAMEIGNVPHTIGSQFLVTLSENNGLIDMISSTTKDNNDNNSISSNKQGSVRYLSLGTVAEDSQHVLSKLNRAYCDDDGRPFADIRISRALVIHDPFDDPEGMDDLLKCREVVTSSDCDIDNGKKKNDAKEDDGYALVPQSPTYDRPPEETVPVRIQADDTTLFATAGWDDNNDEERQYEDEDEEDEATRQKRLELQARQEEEWKQRQDTSRAVMLEMLGDRPDTEIEAPENVLFVCKLNPYTNDEDLELIFSRFDQESKAEIIRDPDTGASLQYAFVEFRTNEAANEAYLKMNNALVDDRRIKVDFSQSVANVWDRFNKKYRKGDRRSGIDRGFADGGRGGGRGGRGGRGRGQGRGQGRGGRGQGRSGNMPRENNNASNNRGPRDQQRSNGRHHQNVRQDREEFDDFGRKVVAPTHNYRKRNPSRSMSRSRSPSREEDRKERRRSRSNSEIRHRKGHSSRQSRSYSSSSDHSRHKKKHHKHRRKDSSRRKRSRSRDRERKHKHKKHHHNRRRDYSDESDDDDRRRNHKKHSRRHDNDDDKHHHRRHRDRSRDR